MSVSQKQGVFDACVAFCEENGIQFDAGQKFEPTKDQHKAIVEMVTQAMFAGEINLDPAKRESKYSDIDSMRKYCDGLVGNWLRKDLRLNGNVPHEIKNPGSRAGAGDATLKELKKLRKIVTKQEELELIDSEIEKRLAEIKASKAQTVEIDASVLPDDLKHLISNS